MAITTARRIVTIACFLSVATGCWAQVSFEWSGRFAARGAPAPIRRPVWHDFGQGPELCAIANVGTNFDQVVRLDEEGWQTVGPILQGTIHDLASFDSGSGPQLYASGSLLFSSHTALGHFFRWTGTQWTQAPAPGWGVSAMTIFDFGAGPRLCTFSTNLLSFNGMSWSVVPGSMAALGDNGSDFVTFDDGAGPRLFAASGSDVRKWTGASWQILATVDYTVNALAVFNDGTGAKLYAGGSFTQMNGAPMAAIARWNGGLSWSPVGPGLSFPQPPMAVIEDLLAVQAASPLLYAAGRFSNAGPAIVGPVASWNGTAWAPAATSFQNENGSQPSTTALAVSGPPGGETLYLGGKFNRIDGIVAHFAARRPAGQPWSAAPATANGGPGGQITASAVYDGGNGPELVVAGSFESIGGAIAHLIARWNGTDWLPLGSGVDGLVTAMTPWHDGVSTALYVTGQFSVAGGVACNNIAKWDGNAWSALGSGLSRGASPPVLSLLALDAPQYPVPYLVAGGNFGMAGGQIVSGIAAWNGAYWSPIGGADWATNAGGIKALAVWDDGSGPQIYAAGHGGSVGGTPVNGMQRWNGLTWSAVPFWNAPTLVVIWGLEVFDDGQGPELYVSYAGTSSSGEVVKLTGTSGTVVAGLNGTIRAMRVFDDGDGPGLYLGGLFTSVYGMPASGVVRYRTGAFAALGSGLNITPMLAGPPPNPTVLTLSAHDDGSGNALFAGGTFAVAGGRASSGVAQWTIGAPILDLAQPITPGGAAFIHCSNLQSGREYFNIFSTEVCGGGPGSGPYLGLCASDPMSLLVQLSVPLETPPFHFLGIGGTRDFGPYGGMPVGLTIEAITIDVTGAFWRVSAVDSITFQ
jgi:trimeric autotransporter adhesin